MDSGTITQKRQPKYLQKLEEFGLVFLVYVGIIEVEQLTLNILLMGPTKFSPTRWHTRTSHLNLGDSTTKSGIFSQRKKSAIAISTVALFDFQMSIFIVDNAC
jgi:hypothetical protein